MGAVVAITSPADDPRFEVLGVRISAVNLERAAGRILDAVQSGDVTYVCVTGVHGVMECCDDLALRKIHNESFLTVPDGMPLVWIARRRGLAQVGRVYGPDLVREMLRRTAGRPIGHFWAGSTAERLEGLSQRLRRDYPQTAIAGFWVPPFRPLAEPEWDEIVAKVLKSDARLVWLGLSTPKQERMAAELARRLHVRRPTPAPGHGIVVIGVGAAFDILAGSRREAPRWVQRCGLQWAHRMLQEPRRLAPRYLRIIPAFLWALARQQRRSP